MDNEKFGFKTVDAKESRKFKKGSKYDPMLDKLFEYMKKNNSKKPVELEMEIEDPSYLRLQLKKRLDARKITDITVSVSNKKVYFEKVS